MGTTKKPLTIIKQKHYGILEIDSSEKDMIQIFMEEGNPEDIQLVQVERKNLPKLIEILQKEVSK